MIINDTFFSFLQPYSLDIRQPLRSESYRIIYTAILCKKKRKKKKRSNKIHDENDEIRNAFAWQLTVDHKVNMTAEFLVQLLIMICYYVVFCNIISMQLKN